MSKKGKYRWNLTDWFLKAVEAGLLVIIVWCITIFVAVVFFR